MQLSIDKYLKGDKAIWSIIILLSIISAIMAYSASANMAYRLTDGDAIPFFFRHLI